MSKYIETVVNASGGFAAPAEVLKEEDIRESLKAAGVLVPEEQDLANALLEIVEKHGKFNDDNTGVWAGYTSAKENAENAEIGVKCGNCVFWEAPNGCKVIVAETEENGLCRFAVLPDGTVTASADTAALEKDKDDPCWSGYVQVGMKKKNGKRVPNCVPSSASIDYLVDTVNSEYGVSRHVSKESAYAVARNAADKYDYLSDEELYSAVLWELHSFAEYATEGESEDADELSEYSSYLPEGHPSTQPSITASATWLAGASDFDNSSRDAVLTAFSESEDYVRAMHATTRLRAIISSGSLSSKTLHQLKDLVARYSKVD
jgi:hypothetical protein